MPQFIHLADDRDVALIRKNGIEAQKIHGRATKGVFATPVLQNYYLSHQWEGRNDRHAALGERPDRP